MGELIEFPRAARRKEPELTKRQLAIFYNRTPRWVEMQVAAGMPSYMKRGRRMFRVAETDPWLRERRSPAA